jgi:hypothetical protein
VSLFFRLLFTLYPYKSIPSLSVFCHSTVRTLGGCAKSTAWPFCYEQLPRRLPRFLVLAAQLPNILTLSRWSFHLFFHVMRLTFSTILSTIISHVCHYILLCLILYIRLSIQKLSFLPCLFICLSHPMFMSHYRFLPFDLINIL